jgi:hypothetical protein
MNYCFRVFYKEIKKHIKDSSVSDEVLLDELLSPIVLTYNLKNKNDDPLYFDKTKTSKIINGKVNVSTTITKHIDDEGHKNDVKGFFDEFIEKYISDIKIKELANKLSEIIRQSVNVDLITKQRLQRTKNNNFIFECFLESFRYPNKITNDKELIWELGSNKIYKVEGDLFNINPYVSTRQRSIVVIPVNTGFDVHITRKYENDIYPLVSETTIHGYWINMMNKAGINCDEIQKTIEDNLKSQQIRPTGKSKTKNSNQNIYPIGTIAVVQYKRQDFYLLAISNFDENNNAHALANDLEIAIEKLIKFYDLNGQGYKMFVPLIGTGRSRAGLTHKKSFDLLINTFIKFKEHINGEIYIVDKGNNL